MAQNPPSETEPVQTNSRWPNGLANLIIAAVLIAAAVPFLLAFFQTPPGSRYLGFEYNTDDHMVYAAWMRQAMEGRFLFDNRFTTLPQPGLTVHVYFLLLGWLAKLIGIPFAAFCGRILCSGVFLFLLTKLIRRLGLGPGQNTLALLFASVGGGLGFLTWQMFGVTFTKPPILPIGGLLQNTLPVDVWQPEAFAFPSLLTNGLFAVSLCLILGAFLCILDARSSWKPVVLGFICMGLLMNIHSYDVLTVTLVLIGLVTSQAFRKDVQLGWILRAVVVGAGVVIPALWFVHVLQNDPVFQSRAATETYSPNFRAVFAGYLPLLGLGSLGIFLRVRQDEANRKKLRLAGLGLFGVLNLILLLLAGNHTSGYFLPPALWGAFFLLGLISVGLVADESPAWNLLFSWAFLGLFAIYFPDLFQRKLTMGLSIPWAILAGIGLYQVTSAMDLRSAKLIRLLGCLVTAASSLLWLVRDFSFIEGNVANTTRHPVYLDSDLVTILKDLDGVPGRKVVIALPGVASPNGDSQGNPLPDSFSSPVLPDVSPIITGLTGAYTTAGHWSETPDYLTQTRDNYRFLLAQPAGGLSSVMTPEERKTFEQQTGANYAVIPSKSSSLPLLSPTDLGTAVFSGDRWTLVRLR